MQAKNTMTRPPGVGDLCMDREKNTSPTQTSLNPTRPPPTSLVPCCPQERIDDKCQLVCCSLTAQSEDENEDALSTKGKMHQENV